MNKKKEAQVIDIKEVCWCCKKETKDNICCEKCSFCTCLNCLTADLTCSKCNTGGEG